MGTAEKKTRYSVAEYLAMEKESEGKHEYHGGEIFAMSGGTLNHSLISASLSRELGNKLMDGDCRVFDSNLQIRIESDDSVVYPDAMVLCGPPDFYQGLSYVVTNPKTIFEVLSDSTAGFDRGGKFKKYQTLPSLEEYVVVEQNEATLDVFRRMEGGLWEIESYQGLDAQVQLKSLGIAIPMRGIYHKVEFPPLDKEKGQPT